MGLLQDLLSLFGSSDLYEVLGVGVAASEAQVRRAYYRNSLKVHPDRAPGDPHATAKFQALGRVYSVLSDPQQRAAYDEQGVVDEEAEPLSPERNWDDYLRMMFPKITLRGIQDFERAYQGSAEERADLLRLYRDCAGDLSCILEGALCCTAQDEPRVTHILQEAVLSGELPALRAFTEESSRRRAARKRKADRERAECEQMKAELGLKDDDGLTATIQRRNASRAADFSSLLGNLEQKYCQKPAATAAKRGKRGRK
ncbi:dnaJ homolog subfamily C member 9-like [Myripristis murdjan]|uniref:DnaJ (Hsp40) homolog, subfamily C, member 9 n=1 Tax=Myripristis murdjan TaxID=586833 RepID=A0A667ZIG4_9TELE|nr:dnaJ homolog subfamily C member 9-like [Myripristis murdjan]